MKYNPNQILADHKKDVGFITSDLDAATAYRDKLYSDRQYLLELQRTLHEELPNLTEEKLKEYQDDFDSTATEATELWRDFEMAIDTVNDRISELEEDDTYFIDREELYTEEESIARKWLPYFSKRQDELYCETENYQCSDVIENIQGFFNDLVFFYRRGKDNVDYCDVIYKGDIYTHPLDTYRNHLIKLEQEKQTMNETKKNSIPENAVPLLSLLDTTNKDTVETTPTISVVPKNVEESASDSAKVLCDFFIRKEQYNKALDLSECFNRLTKARKDLKARAIMMFNELWPFFTSLAKSADKQSDYFDKMKTTFERSLDAVKQTKSDKAVRDVCKMAAAYMHSIAITLKQSVDKLEKLHDELSGDVSTKTPIEKLAYPCPVMPFSDERAFPSIEDRVPELIAAGEWLSKQPNPHEMAKKYFMVIDAVVDDCPTHHDNAAGALMSAYTLVNGKYNAAETDEEICYAVSLMVAALKDFERDVEEEKAGEEVTPHVVPCAYVFAEKDDKLFCTDKYYTTLISPDDVGFISPNGILGCVVNGADAVAYVVDNKECTEKNIQPHGYLVGWITTLKGSGSAFELYKPDEAPDTAGYLHVFQCTNGKPNENYSYLMRPTPQPDTSTPAPIIPAEVIDVKPEPEPTPTPDCLTITHESPWYVIVTPKKPDAKTLAAIKGAGFRWYSAGKRWSLNEKYANPDKLDTLKQLKAFGGDKDSVTFNTSVPDVHAVTIKEIQEKAFDDLVKSLNDGHPLWLKSWFSVAPSGYSYASDKSYSLRNNILLAGHSDFYLTKEGAEKVALEHGHTDPGLIAGAPHYYILAPNIRKIHPDENGKYSELTEELIEMVGEERATTEVYGYRLQRVYPQHFFNPDAVPPKQLQKLKLFDNDRDTEAEKIVSQFITKHNIVLNEIEGSANPTRTRTPDGRIAVNMPSIRQFQMSIAYYSVLFHELTHAANRIRNCQLTKDREELSAEIGSWIILNTLGFDASELIGDMVSYCKSYINVANEKNAMRRAYTHALASANLVLEPIVQRIKQEEAKLASNN